MNDKEFEEYLLQRYDPEIIYYEDRAARSKKLYHCFQWAVIGMSAILPALAALVPEDLKTITIAVSVLLAIGTTALKTFKFQENWLNFRAVAETLKKERHFYSAGLEGYDNDATKRSLFVDRVESLISREHILWIGAHKQNLIEKKEE